MDTALGRSQTNNVDRDLFGQIPLMTTCGNCDAILLQQYAVVNHE